MSFRYLSDVRREAPDGGLIDDDIPGQVRIAIVNFLELMPEDARLGHEQQHLWAHVLIQLDLRNDPNLRGHSQLVQLVDRATWTLVLDACQAIYLFLRTLYRDDQGRAFRDLLNARLTRYYSAYQMDQEGRIWEPGSAPAEEAIEDARALLRSPELAGPDHQFQTALDAYRRVVDPDYPGAISDAVNAIEGVAKIALGDDKIVLGDAMKRIKREKGDRVHPAMVQSINALYGYGTQMNRHGVVEIPDADRAEAEYALHHAAAAIVYVARLYELDVADSPPDS